MGRGMFNERDGHESNHLTITHFLDAMGQGVLEE